MMKTSILRQAAAARVALTARPAQVAFRASSRTLAFSRPSRSVAAVYRSTPSLRLYSSESAAEQPSSDAAPGLITRFEDLSRLNVHEHLVRAITQDMKYETMTDVQAMTISPALLGKDVVAQAKTGTGKTLAFLVPVIQRIIAADPDLARPSRGRKTCDNIRAIIMSPTRELAEQIGVEARRLCRGTGVIVQTAVGGTQKNMMLRRTRIEGCHLMVATPGRLHDLLSDPTSGIAAPKLAALVLDEADRMLEVGFKEELKNILDYLPDRTVVPRQTLLYSATLPKNVVGVARQFINPTNFEFVQTVKADEVPTHERVPQFIVPCRGFENIAPTLLELIRREGSSEGRPMKAIVFLPTTASVMTYSRIFSRLRYDDRSIPYIYEIHSKLAQGQRSRSADNFRQASSAILFSSDVSARGMDFPNVTHVIQVHLPRDRDTYIHRIGRTGRAGKEGKAYLLASDIEIPVARDRLPGLPIQRCTDLESASIDVSRASTLPESFTQIQQASDKVDYGMKQDCYRAFLVGAFTDLDKYELVTECNNLAKYTWGMDQPPAVPPSTIRNLGVTRGLRIADSPTPRYSRDGSYGGARDGRDGRGGRGDDFERMERLAENDGRRGARKPPPTF
ncbi:P-loop containing nucleoside triphosphate hydrolase protein [Achaetomium macrosporum]|uniref:ATP-dependent RNA helicase n=1 Tax=Achaetomium macrosporum TaxID=79813 RepID=A0AAN7C8C4_9PEZI|nr:P-loop containing nucleoside triphosphate hydrolase protein [Achaetomium macrosporum]